MPGIVRQRQRSACWIRITGNAIAAAASARLRRHPVCSKTSTRYWSVLAPITFVFCAIRAWRERTRPRLLFWLWCLFGLALMTDPGAHASLRHVRAVSALAGGRAELADRWPEHGKRTLLIASLALLLSYAPTTRHQLIAPAPKAADNCFSALPPHIRTAASSVRRGPRGGADRHQCRALHPLLQ